MHVLNCGGIPLAPQTIHLYLYTRADTQPMRAGDHSLSNAAPIVTLKPEQQSTNVSLRVVTY